MTQPPPWAIAAARAAHTTRPAALPSVSLAQWALESAWGRQTTGAFNFFGIKAMPRHPSSLHWTHEVVKGERQLVQCAFRDFESPVEAFGVHGDLLQTASSCAAYRAALPNLATAADLLGHSTPAHPRYATDPDYGAKLMAVIRGSNLTEYDHA